MNTMDNYLYQSCVVNDEGIIVNSDYHNHQHSSPSFIYQDSCGLSSLCDNINNLNIGTKSHINDDNRGYENKEIVDHNNIVIVTTCNYEIHEHVTDTSNINNNITDDDIVDVNHHDDSVNDDSVTSCASSIGISSGSSSQSDDEKECIAQQCKEQILCKEDEGRRDEESKGNEEDKRDERDEEKDEEDACKKDVCSVFITYSYPFSDNYHVGILEGKLVFVKIKSSKHDFSLQKEYESGMLLNKISHNHLLKTLSVVMVDSTSFPEVNSLSFPREALITEYICTPVLSDIIYKLSLPSLIDIFIQMIWVVYDVNSKTALYHRDLHAGNIIIERLKSPMYLGHTGIQSNYYCVIYDFGRAVFYEQPCLKSVVSDLKKLSRTLFQKRFHKQGEHIRYLLDHWLIQEQHQHQHQIQSQHQTQELIHDISQLQISSLSSLSSSPSFSMSNNTTTISSYTHYNNNTKNNIEKEDVLTLTCDVTAFMKHVMTSMTVNEPTYVSMPPSISTSFSS